ncbi:SpaA isopeptide-forming pilin-related protein [Anaerococcus kampingiae]|uniref:SpaA isopeptide-forming pilin-related protein n=1 Tax=Anaerococcus kampingae TaxID=3115614 RepID=A0ABW9MK51_9FIRM
MKVRLSLLTRKVFALIIATSMSIPTNVFASEPEPQNYEEDSSIMGLAQNETTEDVKAAEIDSTKLVESKDYLIDMKATLDESLTKIDYEIRLKRKNPLAEGEDKDLSLSLVAMPNINSLRLVSASAIDANKENDLAVETSDDELNSLILKNKAHDEIIYKISADIREAKDGRNYDLAIGLADDNDEVLTYKLIAKEEDLDDGENTTKTIKLEQSDANNLTATYKEEGILGGIFAKYDQIEWTDFLANDTDDVKELDYKLNPDQNQITDETKIRLDYYKMGPEGFVINKEFSQEIDFAEKINFEIPKAYLARLSLSTKVDKKNTHIASYQLNNREIKNPIYIEGSEEENKEEGEDPAPAPTENQTPAADKTPSEENDAPASQAEKEDKKDPSEEEEDPADKLSALLLNRDSLEARLKNESRLTEAMAKTVDEITSRLYAYDKDQIYWEDLLNYTKAIAQRDKLEEADLREIIGDLITGLNKETYKVANINIDEIIRFVYPQEKENPENQENKPEEPTNLEKADKELKEALADKSKGIEEIQALLDSFEKKYKLTREDQEKLMTANNDAINALVEKDREENTRFNNLRQLPQGNSDSFEGKKFKLKTKMQVKATSGWPIPSGWYFDVNLGPYLKEDKGQPLNDLYNNGQLIATAQFMKLGNDTVIRYTYVRKVTQPIDLNIDQNLEFDAKAIGNQNPITLNIKVAPKNNPVQNLYPITVYKDTPSPVTSEYVVKDEGETKSGTYPYQLDWRTTSQKLKDNKGKVIDKLVDLDKSRLTGAYVEWDIEVDTDKLVDPKNPLEFNNLNLTVFGSANQGLTNIYYKASKNKDDLETTDGYISSTNLGELLSQNSQISKADLGQKLVDNKPEGNKLYIKVKATIDPDQVHETYSIGFRLNPDKNYIDGLLQDILNKYNSIPTPLKWLKGVKEARRFAEVPFNLVETNIPATFLGLTDRFTNERFYYDNTRTIVANRKSDTKVDWYALDLIRRGESQDPALDNPDFDRNNGKDKKTIRAKKVYYLPLKDGGYRRTTQAGDVVLQNGQYFPGTIVSYEYPNHSGKRDDTYNFRPNLKDKKKFNIDESYDYEGGRVNLFTEKISAQDLAKGYIAYIESPYPIMRINRNFDMVSCFNDRVNAPVYTGNTKIFLDKHEDVSGDYLLNRLNESIGNQSGTYSLKNYLAGNTYDGVSLNHNGDLSQGQAMEELMKKIYFYGEEVKKEYSKDNNNQVMHRLIESSMYQRVIHHFTDGKSLEKDYFDAPSSYNVDEWKVPHTLSGTRQTYPKTGWDGSFEGKDDDRKTDQGLRKLKDNETQIGNYPPVQSTQYEMAQKLYNKVIASYREGNDWNDDKADSVKLVFYSHTDEGKYQELIAGRVMAPIEIDKYKKGGEKLKDAKFRFTNIDTGEKKEWTSTDDDKAHKLYLRPGKYKVQEMKAPKGYQKIQDFDIEVIRKEIHPDDGRYDAKKLPSIHVNDGFETEVSIDQKTVPKDTDGKKPLVVLDEDNKIKVKVTNIEDNLGKLEFIKRNKFIKLDGAEFRLRKIEASDLADAKNKFKDPSKLTYDSKYDKTEKGNIGEFKFDHIPAGFYVLEETKVPEGYEKAPLYLIEAKEITDANQKKKVQVSFVQEYKEVANEKGEKEAKIEDANLETEKAKRDGKTVDLPIIRNKTKKTEIKFRKVRTENLGTDKEHLGLGDAKFRLMSLKMVDGDFYLEEAYTDNSKKTEPPRATVDGQQAEGGGYITFKDLKVGEYLLEELEAPKGYKKTNLYGWKLVVSLDKDGNFTHKLYEVPKAKAGENQDKIFNSNKLKEVEISNIIKGHEKVDAYQIGNEARTIDIDFKKYKGKIVEKDGKTEVEATEVNEKLLGKDNKPVSFNLYNSDFYGAIIGEKDEKGNFKPINKEPIIQDDKGIFHLGGLEFGGYYILRETNPPKDYNKADDILLKVEAEAIANEGHMKVIVRDPNTNAKTDIHSVFKGVVDFLEKEQLGKFSIKKVGNAIGYTDKNGNPIRVGLRRAYFRLYTANENYEIEYKDKDKKYPKEYIQKVTPGVPITKDDGKGGQTGKSPKEIEEEAPNQGIVTFDQLKPGHYVLEEFRGPAGYERDPNPWYILVERDGTVKKYRDNPSKTRNPKQMDYSAHAPRYRMAGLDLSEPLQFNRLMAAPTESYLQELEYDASSDDLNIKVWASEVDTKNGKRTINFSISPKAKASQETEEQIIGNKIQLVFVIDRSKDASELTNKNNPSGPTLDKNINKLITDIVDKAKKSNASIDATFIQYDNATNSIVGGVNQDLLALDESISDTQPYTMTTPSNPNGENVTIKDYLGKIGVKKRVANNIDGNDRLAKNRDTYYNQITNTNEAYDKRIFINISNFISTGAKTFRDKNEGNRIKYQAAEIIWQFRNKAKPVHFDTWMSHIDLYSGLNSEYTNYMANNTANDPSGNILSDHFKFFRNDDYNNNGRGQNVSKDFFDNNILTDDNFIKERKIIEKPSDEYLVKDASLNATLRNQINLLETSATIGSTNLDPITSKSGTNDSIKLDNINLKKGETLDFSYTIDLKDTTEFDEVYPINASIKFVNDGKESSISSVYPSTNSEISTKKIKEDTPTPDPPTPDPGTQEGHKVNTSSTGGGSISASPQNNVKPGTEVTITITPNPGKKLAELLINGDPAEVDGSTCTFEMPDRDVNVEASFIDENTPHPTGEMILKANFIYSNQKDGIDNSKDEPKGSPGTVELFVNKRQGLVDNWVKVPNSKRDAPYKGTLEYKGLDLDSDYKLVYTRDTEIAGGWGSETVSEYRFDSRDVKENNTVIVNISNGNLTEIFNHDETGFRIPLRITKVNENKAALTGSQFKARKLVNGERVPIYEKKEDGTYVDTGKTGFPKYYDEKFDGVSEATGKPGDNYFRELTPGIYELEEIKTPDNTYRPPKDKNGNDMKWYFKVVINKEKVPRDANYMDITFDFEHTFSENDDFNIGITEAEKKELIGKTIKGFKKGDPDFARYIEEVKDDGRSDPARPDAPYKWIHDARVTNYKNKTKLNFFKKDKASYQNIGGAEFSLRKAKLDKDGKLVFENNKPAYEKETTKGADGLDLTPEQLDSMRVQPYDEKEKFAKAISNDQLGVEFTNIGEGTYILEEIKPANGFKPTDSFLAITFTEDEKGSWKQEVKGYEKNEQGIYQEMSDTNKFFSKNTKGEFVSVNNEKAYIDLKFQKIEGKKAKVKEGDKIVEKEVPVESADFKLTQVDKDGKKIEGGYEKTIYSYSNSNFEFRYLPIGRYKLQETRAITKFEKPDPWFFNVDQDSTTHKLKLVFESDPDGKLDESIGFKTKQNGDPDYDDDGNLQDIKIRNYSKTNFSFKKFSSDLDDKGNKKPLKDAYFRLTKVRFSMDEKAKAYEYYGEDDNATLKKYTNGKKVTEYTTEGNVQKFTYDNKEYKYDENNNLISVGGQTPTEEDKKVKPDAISNATGKYSALRRSQSSGKVDFQNLGEGIYQLEEVGIPEGYQSNTKQFKWIFKVEKTDDGLQIVRTYKDKDGKELNVEEEYFKKYEPTYYTDVYSKKFKDNSNVKGDGIKSPYEITNTKTTTDLKWKKIGSTEKTNVITKDTKFVLLKTSDNPGDIDSDNKETVKKVISGQSEFPPYQVESDSGVFEIKDLAKGVYVLIETKAPDGYEIMTRKIVIKVYEDAKGVIKKAFYEVDQNGNLVKEATSFENLRTTNVNSQTIVDTKPEDTFYVINKPKEYFLLTKGYLDDKDKFTHITKGKLDLKLYPENKDDRNTYQTYSQSINLDTDKEPNRNDPAYKFSIDGIRQQMVEYKKGEITYILEETSAPDGFVKTTNKYKIKFVYTNNKFYVKLMGVEVNGQVVNETDDKKPIPSEGLNIYNGDGETQSSILHIVNTKAEVVFTKIGKYKVEENGKLVDKETKLKDVEFYLEKQDPDDIQKENQGYYPLTANMEMIKPRKNDDGTTTYYYISKKTGEEVKVKNYDPEKITDPPVGIYKSDEDGKFKITNLTDGYYRVIEPKPATDENGKDYMKVNGPIKTFKVVDGRVKIYTVDKDNKTIEKEVDGTSEATVTHIINQKPGKGEFTLTKEDEDGGKLDGVEFTLYKTDGETQVGEKQTTNSNGEIKFTGLPYGYYWLKETKTKDGFILDTKKKLISLGGDKKWDVPGRKEDVWKAIKFEGKQDELVSTADTPNKDTVYPNKAEGIFAKFNFKIDEKADIKPGDYFTIKFSDNVDLDGINKNNSDKGQKGDQYFDIIGPAGLLAKAEVNPDRRSITYIFTEYVKDYKPNSMSMFLQLFPNRRKVDHKQDIEVTADIGHNTDPTNPNYSNYHYSDSITIDYRGKNEKIGYNGYQNPDSDISSYMLRLNPDGKTFTAILYLNPRNREMLGKTLSFTTDEDILVNDNLSVKTYIKNGAGSHPSSGNIDGWEDGDLPDSYDIYEEDSDGKLKVRSDLSLITDKGDEYNWYPTKTWTESLEVNPYYGYDYSQYDYNYGRYRYYKYVTKDNRDDKITRKIDIPTRYLNRKGDSKTATYVIEIKGELNKNAKSLKTRADETHYNYRTQNRTTYKDSYKSYFETWSQFFNPGASGNVSKEIKLVNFKNKIEFAKVDGGVLSNVVDKTEENSQKLKDLGIGLPLKGAEFKLVKDGTDVDKSTRTSDDNGIFSWEGLAPGTYQVIETKSPDDTKYDLPKDAISTFKVDENGNIVEIKNNKQILENYRKAEIKIRKTDQDGNTLDGAEFLLTATGKQKYTANIGTKQADNTILFDKLPAGTYTLTEEKAPQGYTKSKTVWNLEVTKDGKVKWTNSFDDTNDMKKVSVNTYSGDADKENLKSEILGIDTDSKTFRQKITIKARSSELEKARLILDSVNTDLILSQTNTKVRLVQASGDTIIEPDNSSYTVEINNGNTPNLTLRIAPPYREEKKNNPVGSSSGNTSEENKNDADAVREYILIVDMPYKDNARIGAKATYDVGQVDKETGKVTFGTEDIKTVLDKYVAKSSTLTPSAETVNMKVYENKYLARDINLLITDIGNIKKPSIYFQKVDETTKEALQGAEFELQQKQKDGKYLPIKKDGTVVTPAGTTPTDKLIAKYGTDGKFSFENIPDGEYRVYETKAPDGYSLMDRVAFRFKVEKGKIYELDKHDDKVAAKLLKVNGEENSDKYRIKITNKKAEYPYTGGPGTWIGYTLAGLAVMLGGVFIYFKRQARLAQ